MIPPYLRKRSDYRHHHVVLELVLVPVFSEDGAPVFVPVVFGQRSGVHHVIYDQIGDLLQVLRLHVQNHRPVQEEAPELEQGMQREGRHVRL